MMRKINLLLKNPRKCISVYFREDAMKDVKIEKPQFTHCLRCGRILKSSESKERGYGKSCAERMQRETKFKLF